MKTGDGIYFVHKRDIMLDRVVAAPFSEWATERGHYSSNTLRAFP
jgi:hypothetical protein